MYLNKYRKYGFTLIELVVVVTVLAVISAVLVPAVGKMVDKAQQAKTAADLDRISKAMVSLYEDTGRWPRGDGGGNITTNSTTATNGWNSGFNGLIRNNGTFSNATWNGPYLSGPVGNDPFNRPYFYDGGGLTSNEKGPGQTGIFSAGPNGAFQSFNRADLTAQADDIAHYFSQ